MTLSTIRDRLEGPNEVERAIEEINRLLVDQKGFHGEADNLYGPQHIHEIGGSTDRTPASLSRLTRKIARVSTSGSGTSNRGSIETDRKRKTTLFC